GFGASARTVCAISCARRRRVHPGTVSGCGPSIPSTRVRTTCSRSSLRSGDTSDKSLFRHLSRKGRSWLLCAPAVWAPHLPVRVELDWVGGKPSDKRIGSDSLKVTFRLPATRSICVAIEGPRPTHLACAGQRLVCPSMG